MDSLGSVLPTQVGLVAAYHAFAATYFLWQRDLARRARDRTATAPRDLRILPRVDVIVTSFRERPDLLAACLESIAQQDYPSELLRVFVVDDGSPEVGSIEGLIARYASRPGWTFERCPSNVGKRAAQNVAFGLGFGDLVAFVDSDTVLQPDGIRRHVNRFADPAVGSACANIKVRNGGVNWLTRAQNQRYQILFEQERAAQGEFGTVFCCAGPFSMFRREALEAPITLPYHDEGGPRRARLSVWQHYLRQPGFYFHGSRPTAAGDDLHLPHLVLMADYDSVYEPGAVAHTEAPERLRQFRRQQQRWNRSLYRELPWTLDVLRSRNRPYLWLDVLSRALLPLLLALVTTISAVSVALAGSTAGRLIALAALASVPVGHWLLLPRRNRNLAFFVQYGVVYVSLLLLTKAWALFTPHVGAWGTRTRAAAAPPRAGRVAVRRTWSRRAWWRAPQPDPELV